MQGLRPAAFAFPKLGVFAALLALACALSVAVLAAMPATAHAAPSDRGYTWPFKIDGYLSQDFKGSAHGGTDLGAPMGTNVYACADGIVKYVQKWDGHSTYDMQSYGNLVIIYHPGARTATYYAHLQSFNVKNGQMVRQGTKIGKVGSTGNSTGPHCHIELYYLGEGDIVDLQTDYLLRSYSSSFNCGWGSYALNRLCENGVGAPCRLNPAAYFGG